MSGDTTLVLGDFAFAGLEIPDGISVGGVQELIIHELIGGIRVIDAMGRRDSALEWSGWFMGQDATARQAYLDAYRIGGKPQTLTWGSFNYTVVVAEFTPRYQREFEYSYRIRCEVQSNNTSISSQPDAQSIDTVLADDLESANDLASDVDDPALNSQMQTLSSAFGSVTTFAGAAQSVINSVTQPLAGATAIVAGLVDGAEAAVGSAAGFAGVFAGGQPTAMIAAFRSQVTQTGKLTSLNQLQGLLGRMNANLGALNSSDKTVATAGGNLYAIAAQEYGDTDDWTAIAQANGLSDPFVQGTQVLTIPALPGSSDGILTS